MAAYRVVYEEVSSGKKAARPELGQCQKTLHGGDTLVVWCLDRLGLSLPSLVSME